MIQLDKFSIGVGDRFGHQALAQLHACALAGQSGLNVIPVWNKSNREHTIIGSEPISVRAAADRAVKEAGWRLPYFCDADHINLSSVDRFIDACDFYTIDVADFIGRPAEPSSIDRFVANHPELIGSITLDILSKEVEIRAELLLETAAKFLFAIQQAGAIYRHIVSCKGEGAFIAEISMDETDAAQTPAELLIILAAIADERIPIQTIAPKFSGRFNKGVDYVGDVRRFSEEIELDIAAIQLAVRNYGLPPNLKLSIHSGSDKFSIYPALHAAMNTFNTGIHLKTAGTTWLEEIIGLAEAGGDGLALAREIYAQAFSHAAELCAPYATVIDIDSKQLPSPADVAQWSSDRFTSALRHNSNHAGYNPSFRQLLHVGFKVAAKLGKRYTDLLDVHRDVISRNVTENLFDRHIAPVFLGTIPT